MEWKKLIPSYSMLKPILKKHSLFLIAMLLLLLLQYFFLNKKETVSLSPYTTKQNKTADTYIPPGHVLIPIDIINAEKLDNILGSFGVVDLYSVANHDSSKAISVAKRVKILRAPLKPDHFAILVKEHEAKAIMKYGGPFSVSVQNPQRKGTQFNQVRRKFSRIIKENIL